MVPDPEETVVEPEPQDDQHQDLLDPSSYCSCGHCVRMDTLEESFCCRSHMKRDIQGINFHVTSIYT